MTRKGGHRFFLAQTRNAFVAEIMLNQRLRARGRSEEAPSRLLQFQQKRKPILTSGTVEKQELRADRRSEEAPSRLLQFQQKRKTISWSELWKTKNVERTGDPRKSRPAPAQPRDGLRRAMSGFVPARTGGPR